MKIISNIISVFSLAALSVTAFAQNQLPDGVSATKSFREMLETNYAEENAIPFDIENISFSAKVPLNVYVIKDINGSNGVKLTDIDFNVNIANNFFSKIGIKFVVDTMVIINDFNYTTVNYNKYRQELLKLYAVPNKINLFLADSINMDSVRCFGFTYFPDAPDSNFIFLDKTCLNGNYLSTMLGHYMGLLSTHDKSGDRENVDEKNCATSGDYLCDTYADPDLLNKVDSTCLYTGSSKDKKGKYYIPTVANIMSNSRDNCKCKFTPLQYRRMYYYFRKYRQSYFKL